MEKHYTDFIIVNDKKFRREVEKAGFYPDGFVRDISFKMDESGAGVHNDCFEVETGRKNAHGCPEALEFDVLNKYHFDDDGNVLNTLKLRFRRIL